MWVTLMLSERGGYFFIAFLFLRCSIRCMAPRSNLTANADVLRAQSEPASGILRQAYYPRLLARNQAGYPISYPGFELVTSKIRLQH